VKLHIHHRTIYHYADKVTFGPHRLMFRPRENHGIRMQRLHLQVSPAHRLRWMRDLYENNIVQLDLTEPAQQLAIEWECHLDIAEDNPFDFIIDSDAAEYPFDYEHELSTEVLAFSENIYPRDVERLRAWLHPYWHPGRRLGTLDLLQELNKTIYRTIEYQRRDRKGVQSPAETLELKTGSCRDLATLFIEACRLLGLAARFVSGYMYSPEITGRMSMHGWAEVYLPGAGWIGFDPSWGILAAAQYVPVGVARHSEHVPPISGTYFGYPRAFLRTEIDLYVKKLDEPLPTQIPSGIHQSQHIGHQTQSAQQDTTPAIR
jgi:transglutaminase-like putative cysteine protease